MAFSQDLNYRVRIDDSDLQAKLSQMRSSIDMTMSGMGGMGGGMMGMGGMPMSAMMGNMGLAAMPGTSALGGGMADFGSQIRPITYTPPAIAMQPHFGMFQIQQTLGQAIGNSFQPLTPFGNVPPNISAGELSAYSARQAGNRLGDMAAVGGMATASFGLGTIGGLAGGALGTLVGGPIGGFVGGLAGSMVTGALMDNVSDYVAGNISMQNALEAGSFRFMTGGPDRDQITGRGMNRRSRREAADFIQNMELNDVRYGASEYSQILESGMQMDMFSGTRDSEDFQRRFKDLVETVKTVSATLHTSLKEGMEAMRGMRDMGVDTASGQMQLALRSETLGRMTGRTGMEMMAIGQAGAEMFRGTGINMQLGFESVQNNATSIRSMLNQGTLDRQVVAQAGGETALAQQMTASALGNLQTSYGRAFLMSGYDGHGGFTNGFVEGAGSQTMMGMMSRLTNTMNGPASILNFEADQAKMVSQLGPQGLENLEIGAIMSQARQYIGFGADPHKAFITAGLRMNKSLEVLEAYEAKMNQDPEQLRSDMRDQIDSMNRQAMGENVANTYGMKAISNAVNRQFARVGGVVNDARDAVAGAFEGFAINLTGGIHSDLRVNARTTQEGQALARERGYVEGGDIDMSRGMLGGVFSPSGILQDLAGSGGSAVESAMRDAGMTVKEFSSRGEAEAFYRKNRANMIITSSNAVTGALTAVSMSDYNQMVANANKYDPTERERNNAEAAYKEFDVDTLDRLEALSRRKERGEKVTVDDVIAAGIRFKDGSAATRDTIGGTGAALIDRINKDYNLGVSSKQLGDARTVMNVTGKQKERAEEALGEARSLLSGEGFLKSIAITATPFTSHDTDNLSPEDISAIADIAGGRLDSTQMRELRQKYGSGFGRIQGFATRLAESSADNRSAFMQAEIKAKALIGNVGNTQDAATPDASKSGISGDIMATSSDQQQQLLQMAKQLESNMQLLITMQKEFQALQNSGRANAMAAR